MSPLFAGRERLWALLAAYRFPFSFKDAKGPEDFSIFEMIGKMVLRRSTLFEPIN